MIYLPGINDLSAMVPMIYSPGRNNLFARWQRFIPLAGMIYLPGGNDLFPCQE